MNFTRGLQLARQAYDLALAALAAARGAAGAAAPNVQLAYGGTTGAAATILLNAPAITKKKSGTCLVFAQGTIDSSGAFFFELHILLDGVEVTNTPQGGAAINGPSTDSASTFAVVTLPDGLPHVFTAKVVGDGGNIACSANNRQQIVVVEL